MTSSSAAVNPMPARGTTSPGWPPLRSGLPVTVAGTTVNRFCSSGLQAIAMAAHMIREGADVAIGGGVESITMLKRDNDPHPWVKEHYPGIYMVMGDTAEVVAKRYGISRQAQDEYALLSPAAHGPGPAGRASSRRSWRRCRSRAASSTRRRARSSGARSTTPTGTSATGPTPHSRPSPSSRPHFDPHSGKGTVTAGNSSQLSDGASATVLMSIDRARALGIKPKLVFRGFAVAGCEPDEMGIGPVFAVRSCSRAMASASRTSTCGS